MKVAADQPAAVPIPRREPVALRFAIAPLLVMAGSLATFDLTAFDLPDLADSLGAQLLAGQEGRSTRPMVEARSRLLWSASLLLFYFVALTVLVYSVLMLVRSLSRRGLWLYGIVGLLIGAATVAQLAYSGTIRNPFSSIFFFTFESLRACACYEASELSAIKGAVVALNLLGALVPPVVLMAGCSAAVLADDSGATVLSQLEVQTRRLKMILNGSSALLVTAIVHQVMWLRWPAALVTEATTAKDITGFAEALSVYWGATYTLLILVFYGPIAWSLNQRARAVIERRPDAAGGLKAEEWLDKHGLSVKLMPQLPQVVAVLAPLLAGPISSGLSSLADPTALG